MTPVYNKESGIPRRGDIPHKKVNMLDTVKLNPKDLEVDKTNNLRISTVFNTAGEEKNACKLFDMADGTEIGGVKAYLNTNNFQLDIMSKGAFIKFSIPKVFYKGNNFRSVNVDQTREVIKHIEKELKENGIKTNLFNSNLSRLDMFKQVTPDEPFYNYAPIFRAVNGTSKQLRDYGSTFLWQNGVEQVVVYDKIAEMLHNKKDISGLPNTIRFENRLMNKRKIEQVLEFNTADELVKYYDELEPAYNSNLKKQLFMLNNKEFNEVLLNDIETRFKYYFEFGGRYWMRKFLTSFGIDQVEMYGIDNVISLARQSWNNLEKQKAYRLKKQLQGMIAENKLITKATPDKTLLTLYNELKLKLVA